MTGKTNTVYIYSMPAIRYFHQSVFLVADCTPAPKPVDVRQVSGSFSRVRWLGMICEAAAERLPGTGYAKVRAHEVTSGDGIGKCEWRRLGANEFVLGWSCYSGDGDIGVYGVVDTDCWPIIVGTNYLRRKPRLKVA